MSHPGGVAHTPEPKSGGGLASVFKSLTGGKPSKSQNAQSSSTTAQQLNGTSTLKSAIYGGPPDHEQLFEQLKTGNSLADRLAAAESLRHAVQDYPLSSVTSIFKEGKDLIEASNPVEARIAGFELLTACVKHTSSSDPERLAYFRVLTAPANHLDFHLQLASVVELTKSGRDLSGFHYDTIPLLTSWLRQAFTTTSAARKQAGRQNRTQKGKAPLGEETNLASLFTFVIDVVKFNFNVSNEETTGDLIDVVLNICVLTPLSSDLKACINVIDATITYGEIPSTKLVDCIKVLCSIHCLVGDVQADAWRSISNLCKSHNGQTTVRILLDILRNLPSGGATDKQATREIRGALSVLIKLFTKNGDKGYPLVPLSLLMDALSRVVTTGHGKVELDILRSILSIFNVGKHGLLENVMEEDWSIMFKVAHKCCQRVLETSDGRPLTDHARTGTALVKEIPGNNFATNVAQTLHNLIIRIEELLVTTKGDFFQRNDCIEFFVNIHPHLPESCAELVIDYYMEHRCCYPSDLQWEENIKMVLGAFFANRSQPSNIRLHALKAVTDVFEVVDLMYEQEGPEFIQSLVRSILDGIRDEKDIEVLQEIVDFSVAVAVSADASLFAWVVDSLRGNITSDRLQSPLGSPPGSRHSLTGSGRFISSTVPERPMQTPSDVVTRGLVQIFMRTMDYSASKSLRMFDELLRIAKSHACEVDARLSALKMLFRLRADWANRIFLTPFTESGAPAASLYRTASSLARKQAADSTASYNRPSRAEDSGTTRTRTASISQSHSRPGPASRTGSGSSRATVHKNSQMWVYPDRDALPEAASNKASPLLASSIGTQNNDNGVPFQSSQVAMNIGSYLEALIGLLQDGCDWEVYSYILVHLAAQLTNHALFKDASPQIKTLKDLLCEHIKNGAFQEPPISSGLRKVDVTISLFQILTIVVSYHENFSKAEEDEIVRTFVQGIGTLDRASKCCIHALSICCHELPASTSKALVTILQKMSQIITQSHVAVHILEFLACLSRLPDLYVNFREEEYRTVFMICFRYLQYVRDQPAKENVHQISHPVSRGSGLSTERPLGNPDGSLTDSGSQPNTSDDLPQYVYTLAYHVIIFWFLSLKLTDRASQVGWISKNLAPGGVGGKERFDEQAQVTLDFMQRVAYADVDESAADPTFTTDRFGEILKKRWIVGHSIVTVEQATRGGWAQITKRQPSGTSCYIIREKFSRPPPHQSYMPQELARDPRQSDSNVVLPSHILLQLIASIPQPADASRPIALPDDEATRRAISTFDRSSTVDGHKVGIIYIGENQTQEAEILANIMGSTDYTDFLSGIGTLTKLKGAKFNTQGLDREYNSDGEHAFCWRDRVTEIVFHVTTQMPTNLEHDPQCIAKKRHIGNDFVNIIFNNSGRPFKFDTFPSDFNYVNIVITPESRASFVATRLRSQSQSTNAFYKVQVMSKPGFPEISPASETKIVSLKALPAFIRLLALNASVFSLVWANKKGGEHVSSWLNRLREINRLRDKHLQKTSTSNLATPSNAPGGPPHDARNIRDSITNLRRSSVANFLSNSNEPASHRSSMLSTAETEVGGPNEEESIVDGLDFSRWA